VIWPAGTSSSVDHGPSEYQLFCGNEKNLGLWT
jgi:hypothetical protein